MEFTAKQIAQLINGRIEGNENAAINSFAKIEEGTEGAISFLYDAKYAHYIYETKCSIVLVNEDIQLDKPVNATLIRVKDAREAVAQLLQMYQNMTTQRKTGIDERAYVSPSAKIGKDTWIAPFVYVGDDVEIGDNCTIYPNVTIYHGCKIGNNVILHAGTVIGADGFGFQPNGDHYDKVPQIGNVIIEDDVEIGANACVDRAMMGSTIIHKGVKLDNLVQIAHNNEIGANTVMSAQVGVAGSTKVGEWCMFGGQVGIAGHITIGNKVILGAQSGVPGSLKDNQMLIGTPPVPQMTFFRSHVMQQKLPDMMNEIKQLKKEIEELKKNK
ncbi:MAG: UDP-3-O-(3-hydroxymyristoyl)glucosamine N-acyltransferase [Prevotella sp.]|jgi:UDP-3-O-[3-hydroxymyristoyl] glucosamine N-acyltransferase|nr:UDP-3-O-(3-hydroxymyristoyl)glucosamine N-acyltransferase [Prevotella sp.]